MAPEPVPSKPAMAASTSTPPSAAALANQIRTPLERIRREAARCVLHPQPARPCYPFTEHMPGSDQ